MSIWSILAEPISIILGIIISVALAWLTPKLASLVGQEKANKMQQAFQAAAERAAGIAILRITTKDVGGRAVPDMNPASAPFAIDQGVDYLKRTMPDTIAKLGVNDAALRQVVEANVGKLFSKNK